MKCWSACRCTRPVNMALTAKVMTAALSKTGRGRGIYLRIVGLDADATVSLPQLMYEEVFNQR